MKAITHNRFAIPLIPECMLSGCQEWAMNNNLDIVDDPPTNLTYYVPYRNTYDRIIRAVAADWHELLIDNGVVNLNETRWDKTKDLVLDFILSWIETNQQLPIIKSNCHSAYFVSHITPQITKTGLFFDIAQIELLFKFLNSAYDLDLSTRIGSHKPSFYNHTIPYWEIENIYQTNARFQHMVDEYCRRDTKIRLTNLV